MNNKEIRIRSATNGGWIITMVQSEKRLEEKDTNTPATRFVPRQIMSDYIAKTNDEVIFLVKAFLDKQED